jgi:hypothetical protein
MINSALSDETKELAAGYVLDELELSEVVAFERMMLEDATLRQEVRELQMVLGGLALDVPQLQPPEHLRAKVLQFADTDRELAVVRPKKIDWSKIVAIFALITAAALSIDNFRLRQDLSFAQQQTSERVANLLQRPNSKLIALTAQTTATSGGTVLFTPGKWQEVVISVKNLPPLPAKQIYRLWLTLNNQQIIYCGEFRTDRQGNASQPINPPQSPPLGTKATGLFVTVDRENAPLLPTGTRIIAGEI